MTEIKRRSFLKRLAALPLVAPVVAKALEKPEPQIVGFMDVADIEQSPAKGILTSGYKAKLMAERAKRFDQSVISTLEQRLNEDVKAEYETHSLHSVKFFGDRYG